MESQKELRREDKRESEISRQAEIDIMAKRQRKHEVEEGHGRGIHGDKEKKWGKEEERCGGGGEDDLKEDDGDFLLT